MLKRKIFDPKIEPSCAYCENGTPTQDKQSILCKRCGVMPSSASCRHFIYDPLERIPRRQINLPHYDAEDFSL